MKTSSKNIIIDVRETREWEEGHLPDALHIPLKQLDERIATVVPDKSVSILCYCACGERSQIAADRLKKRGYRNAASMPGGFNAWKNGRYSRHLSIPEVGEEGQRKLLQAKVLLVGAGGLGSPAAYYLAAAGVGTIGIVDFDRVDESNLQRQILHTTNRVGALKVDSAREALLALNPGVKIETYPVKLSSQNVEEIFKNYDIIVDGCDNFPTRYLVNDACVLLQKPNVHGSVFRFEGQVSVFWAGSKGSKSPCYRCLYPEPPPPELAPSCAEAGVLGVLPGVVGMLEAVETIKIILEKGDLLVGRLLCYDALGAKFRELKLKRDPNCLCSAASTRRPAAAGNRELLRDCRPTQTRISSPGHRGD